MMGWVNLGDFSRRHEKGSIGIIIFYVRCTIFHEPEPFSQRLQSNILKPYIQNNSDYLALGFLFSILTTLIILCLCTLWWNSKVYHSSKVYHEYPRELILLFLAQMKFKTEYASAQPEQDEKCQYNINYGTTQYTYHTVPTAVSSAIHSPDHKTHNYW